MNYADSIQESESALLLQENKVSNTKQRDKIKLLRMLKAGKSLREAAEFIGVSYRQAQRYITIYRDKGMGELMQSKYKTNASKLKNDQIESLRRFIQDNDPRTLIDVQAFIKNNFDKQYTLGGICSLLKRHNIERKDRNIPHKTSFTAS